MCTAAGVRLGYLGYKNIRETSQFSSDRNSISLILCLRNKFSFRPRLYIIENSKVRLILRSVKIAKWLKKTQTVVILKGKSLTLYQRVAYAKKFTPIRKPCHAFIHSA